MTVTWNVVVAVVIFSLVLRRVYGAPMGIGSPGRGQGRGELFVSPRFGAQHARLPSTRGR